MRVDTQHLEKIRGLLATSTDQLDSAKRTAKEAETEREKIAAEVAGLQTAFDLLAHLYASGGEASSSELDRLPASARSILGVEPAPKA